MGPCAEAAVAATASDASASTCMCAVMCWVLQAAWHAVLVAAASPAIMIGLCNLHCLLCEGPTSYTEVSFEAASLLAPGLGASLCDVGQLSSSALTRELYMCWVQ